MRAGDHLEREPHVGDGPRHRPVHLHHLHRQRAIRRRNDARVGHATLGRPDRCDAAGAGGIAQRAADVVAKAKRGHACGQSRPFSAARTTCGPSRIPRIAGDAVQGTVRVNAQPHVGQIGPPDRHRPGLAHPLDDWRVEGNHGPSERRQSPRGRRAGQIDVLLDGEGDAVQRSQRVFGGDLAIRLVGALARLLRQNLDDGVEFRIDGRDPSEMRLDNLVARHLFPGDESRQFARRTAPQVRHGYSP